MTQELKEAFLKAADEIFDKIGQTSVQNYFIQGGDRPVPLKVTSRSGSLMQAVLGGVGGIRETQFTGDGVTMTYGIGHPQKSYAILLHDGGIKAVTEKMRRFFWAKFYTTPKGGEENKMWSSLRFKNSITYKPRPFLEMAINDALPSIPEILRKHSLEALRIEVHRMVAGAK